MSMRRKSTILACSSHRNSGLVLLPGGAAAVVVAQVGPVCGRPEALFTRLHSLRKKSETVIPNLGGFCRGEESALFSATADPSRSLPRLLPGFGMATFRVFPQTVKT